MGKKRPKELSNNKLKKVFFCLFLRNHDQYGLILEIFGHLNIRKSNDIVYHFNRLKEKIQIYQYMQKKYSIKLKTY